MNNNILSTYYRLKLNEDVGHQTSAVSSTDLIKNSEMNMEDILLHHLMKETSFGIAYCLSKDKNSIFNIDEVRETDVCFLRSVGQQMFFVVATELDVVSPTENEYEVVVCFRTPSKIDTNKYNSTNLYSEFKFDFEFSAFCNVPFKNLDGESQSKIFRNVFKHLNEDIANQTSNISKENIVSNSMPINGFTGKESDMIKTVNFIYDRMREKFPDSERLETNPKFKEMTLDYYLNITSEKDAKNASFNLIKCQKTDIIRFAPNHSSNSDLVVSIAFGITTMDNRWKGDGSEFIDVAFRPLTLHSPDFNHRKKHPEKYPENDVRNLWNYFEKSQNAYIDFKNGSIIGWQKWSDFSKSEKEKIYNHLIQNYAEIIF